MVIVTKEKKTIPFDLPKIVDNTMKNQIDFIIKHSKGLAEHQIKRKISQLLPKYSSKVSHKSSM